MSKNSNNKGYLLVTLTKNNISKKLLAHRLVAEAFIPNPNKYPVINHIDGNPINNRIENLEWCTQQYNSQDWVKRKVRNDGLFKKGQIPWNKGKFFPQFGGKNHPNSRKVNQYDLNNNLLNTFISLEDARKYMRKNKSSGISLCCSGKCKTIYGYIWRYAD